MTVQNRKWLDHRTPNWIRRSEHIYHITLCTQPRHKNQLAHPDLFTSFVRSIQDRQSRGLWWPHLVLIMPDHLHGLFSFPETGPSITKVVAKWKEWQARHHGISWQKGFFDHRLRSDESYDETYSYIVENPVRAGLVSHAKEWPFVYREVEDGP